MLGSLRKHALGEPAPAKKARKQVRYPESREQAQVVRELRADHPNVLVMRLENAAKRTPAQYARDYALGMEAGAPDLVLACRGRIVFLEMKTPVGEVSEEQRECHRVLTAMGHLVLVGYGYNEAMRLLREHGVI